MSGGQELGINERCSVSFGIESNEDYLSRIRSAGL